MAFSLFSFFSRKTERKPKTFSSLSVADFKTLLLKQKIQLLDVRRPDEYGEGHIPEAVNIDVCACDFEEKARNYLKKVKRVALYCRSGARSKIAASILCGKGYTVYELDKGFLSWQSAGNECCTD